MPARKKRCIDYSNPQNDFLMVKLYQMGNKDTVLKFTQIIEAASNDTIPDYTILLQETQHVNTWNV